MNSDKISVNETNKIYLEPIIGGQQQTRQQFSQGAIKIGSGDDCDFCIRGQDEVAATHCTLKFQNNSWYIVCEEGQVAWIGQKRVEGEERIEPGALIFLGKILGAAFRIHLSKTVPASSEMPLRAYLKDARIFKATMMANAAKAASEKPFQRRFVERGFARLRKSHRKTVVSILSFSVITIFMCTFFLVHQQLRLNDLRESARQYFYEQKNIELKVARIDQLAMMSGDTALVRHNMELWNLFDEYENKYEAYLKKLGFYNDDIPEDEKIIMRMARAFGECDLNVPKGFIAEVKNYINKWKTTPRYRKAIERALQNRRVEPIAEAMLKNHLPPHFFYIALQESDFDVERCGPETRFGIAKGMWQFIPTTAAYYGLKLGPFVEVSAPDPEDERQNFLKSTQAAAKYLKYIYTTEAQASGLLVVASYNLGENRVRRMINSMPENPRERNFWNLLKNFKIPTETYNYVYYIFSAAVIGENPRLFGFDIEKPIEKAVQKFGKKHRSKV